MDAHPVLIEFPADDPERARRFWSGLLGVSLPDRVAEQGEGWQTNPAHPDESPPSKTAVGIHPRGRGPGDRVSLPYFAVADLPAALRQVADLGGSVVHAGERYAVCRDSEGSPFGLSATAPAPMSD